MSSQSQNNGCVQEQITFDKKRKSKQPQCSRCIVATRPSTKMLQISSRIWNQPKLPFYIHASKTTLKPSCHPKSNYKKVWIKMTPIKTISVEPLTDAITFANCKSNSSQYLHQRCKIMLHKTSMCNTCKHMTLWSPL